MTGSPSNTLFFDVNLDRILMKENLPTRLGMQQICIKDGQCAIVVLKQSCLILLLSS